MLLNSSDNKTDKTFRESIQFFSNAINLPNLNFVTGTADSLYQHFLAALQELYLRLSECPIFICFFFSICFQTPYSLCVNPLESQVCQTRGCSYFPPDPYPKTQAHCHCNVCSHGYYPKPQHTAIVMSVVMVSIRKLSALSL